MSTRAERAKIAGEARRREIANAAAELFNQEGFTRTSIGEIADAVGIAKPSLYHYFGSKGDILAYLHQTFMDLLVEKAEARSRTGARGMVLVRGVVYDILELMESHPGHVRVFVEHHRELPEPVRTKHMARRQDYHQHLVRALEDAMAAGEIRELDAELTALGIFGMSNWAYQWYQSQGRLTPQEIGSHFIDMIERGIQF